jgi:DNA ligase-1
VHSLSRCSIAQLLDEAEIEVDSTLPTDADQFEDLDETASNDGTAGEDDGGATASGTDDPLSDSALPKIIKSEETVATKSKGKKRKLLPATYEPDKRAMSWLKVKKDYME